MNTLIQELVSLEMEEYRDGAYADSGDAKYQLTQFAQLIIKECVQAVYDDGMDAELDAEYYRNRILGHFGIK